MDQWLSLLEFENGKEEQLNAYKPMLRTLQDESDRGCVLVAQAYLDEALEELLRVKFETDPRIVKNAVDPLLKGSGPLSTFYSRIRLAYALGLLNHSTYDILEDIRVLRNKFAHQRGPAQLTDSRVTGILDRLSIEAKRFAVAFSEVMHDQVQEIESKAEELSISTDIPNGLSARRIQFMFCFAIILGEIQDTITKLSQQVPMPGIGYGDYGYFGRK